MATFQEWFAEQLRIERYPVPGEIARLPVGSYLVNVSDEWIPSCSQAANSAGVYYHWLPLNECAGQLGINSIFGALQLLRYAEQQNVPVLLHCHNGTNRSRLVADAYYFMRTGQHYDRGDTTRIHQNVLLDQVALGLLPNRPALEQFLRRLGEILDELDMSYRGGVLTQLKIETGIS